MGPGSCEEGDDTPDSSSSDSGVGSIGEVSDDLEDSYDSRDWLASSSVSNTVLVPSLLSAVVLSWRSTSDPPIVTESND